MAFPDIPFQYPHDLKQVRFANALAFGRKGTEISPDSKLQRIAGYTYDSAEEAFDRLSKTPEDKRIPYYSYRVDEHGYQIPGSVRPISLDQLNQVVATQFGAPNPNPLLVSIAMHSEVNHADYVTTSYVVPSVAVASQILHAHLRSDKRRYLSGRYLGPETIQKELTDRGIFETQFGQGFGDSQQLRDASVIFCEAPLTPEQELPTYKRPITEAPEA